MNKTNNIFDKYKIIENTKGNNIEINKNKSEKEGLKKYFYIISIMLSYLFISFIFYITYNKIFFVINTKISNDLSYQNSMESLNEGSEAYDANIAKIEKEISSGIIGSEYTAAQYMEMEKEILLSIKNPRPTINLYIILFYFIFSIISFFVNTFILLYFFINKKSTFIVYLLIINIISFLLINLLLFIVNDATYCCTV